MTVVPLGIFLIISQDVFILVTVASGSLRDNYKCYYLHPGFIYSCKAALQESTPPLKVLHT